LKQITGYVKIFKILVKVSFIITFISFLLLLTGCPRHIDSLYGVKVAGDGTGGAIAVYEEKLGGPVYAQKISPTGEVLWGEESVLGTNPDSKSYAFQNIQIVADNTGGAIIAWWVALVGSERTPVYQVFKMDSEGKRLWQRDAGPVNQLLSDGTGGVILECTNVNDNIVINRIDANGNYPWGEKGVVLSRSVNILQIASDGSGGAVLTWFSTGRIYAQKINGEGELEWEDGVLLYTAPEDTFTESPQITGDGSGGAIVVWHQVPRGRIEDSSPEAYMMDILAQKVDAGGNVLWRENGLPLEINKAGGRANPIEPKPVSDGAGGVIIVWRDMRNAAGNTANLYAQRIGVNGNIMWQPGGINVSVDAINPNHMIVNDNSRAAFVSYFFSEPRKDLHVQKLAGDGKTLWAENGVQVNGGDYSGYSIAADGLGGLIIGWGVSGGVFSPDESCVQRVSSDGNLLWGEDGIRLNP
jgi:hypothetical protein